MEPKLLVLLAVAFIVVLGAARAMRTRSRERIGWYQQKDRLFTAAERSFLGVLDMAAAGTYRVFGKVRVADVLATAKGLDNSTRASLFNRIRAKHFDFVLCDPKTLDVKAVVELNDKSHESKHRKARDEFLRDACQDAGLPLREVQAQRSYSVEALRQMLRDIEVELRGDPLVDIKARVEPTF